MKALLAASIIALSVSGCADTRQLEDLSYTEKKELAAKIVQSCADQGIKDGTPEMGACFADGARSEGARRQNAAEAAERFGMAMSAGLSSYGESTERSFAAPSYAPQYRAPINCTSNVVGTYTYTNCY